MLTVILFVPLHHIVEAAGFEHVHWLISTNLLILKVVEELLVILILILKIFIAPGVCTHGAHSDKIVAQLLIVVHDIFLMIAVLIEIDWRKLLIPLQYSLINVLSGTFVLSQTFALTSVCRSRIHPNIRPGIVFLCMNILVALHVILVQSQVLTIVSHN